MGESRERVEAKVAVRRVTTRARRPLAVALVALASVAGCSSGDDVVLVAGRSSCSLASDEDVCTRFGDLEPVVHATFLAHVQAAALVASDGADSLRRVEQSCEALARALAVPVSDGRDRRFALKDTCRGVAHELERIKTRSNAASPRAGWPTMTYTAPVCDRVKLPACIEGGALARSFTTCDASPIAVDPAPTGPSLGTSLLANALEIYVPDLLIVTTRPWPALPSIAGDAVAGIHPRARACLPAATTLMLEGFADRRAAYASAVSILEVLGANAGDIEIHTVEP